MVQKTFLLLDLKRSDIDVKTQIFEVRVSKPKSSLWISIDCAKQDVVSKEILEFAASLLATML